MKQNLIGFGIGILLVLIGALLLSAKTGHLGSIIITAGMMAELFFLVKIMRRVWQTRKDAKQ